MVTNLGWKIYFWIFAVSGLLNLLFYIFNITKLSVGDYLAAFLMVIYALAIFVYAFKKPLLKQKHWKIVFWSIVGLILVSTLYCFFPSLPLRDFFIGKYYEELISVLPSSFIIFQLAQGLLCVIPIFYVLVRLAFFKSSYEKVPKVPENLPTTHLATASLILSLCGITLLGFIFGILALNKIRKGTVRGVGFAWTGIWIFIYSTLITAWIIYFIVYFVTLPGMNGDYRTAIKHMSSGERLFYDEKVSKIKQDFTVEDVTAVLGNPSSLPSNTIDGDYQYACPEELFKGCSISVTVTNNLVSEVSWFDFKRFSYTRTFTEQDKVYYFGNDHLLLTLEPNWTEYEYSKEELKDNPPLTFYLTNGAGTMYLYEESLDKPFDLQKDLNTFSVDIRPKASDVKKYSQKDWTVYEFSNKDKDNQLYRVIYLVKQNYFVTGVYKVSARSYSPLEEGQFVAIMKSIEVREK